MDSDIVTTAASTSTGGADVAATAALSNPQRPIQTPSPTASPIKPQSYLSQQSVNSTMSAREMRRFQRAVNSLTQLHQNAEEGQSPIVGGDLKTKITSSPRETRRILLSQQQLQLQQQPPADGLIQQQRQQQQLLADPEPSEHASKRPIARVCKTDIISPTGGLLYKISLQHNYLLCYKMTT
jgi:hypothetical protein